MELDFNNLFLSILIFCNFKILVQSNGKIEALIFSSDKACFVFYCFCISLLKLKLCGKPSLRAYLQWKI